LIVSAGKIFLCMAPEIRGHHTNFSYYLVREGRSQVLYYHIYHKARPGPETPSAYPSNFKELNIINKESIRPI
jgi:hypothetical protein